MHIGNLKLTTIQFQDSQLQSSLRGITHGSRLAADQLNAGWAASAATTSRSNQPQNRTNRAMDLRAPFGRGPLGREPMVVEPRMLQLCTMTKEQAHARGEALVDEYEWLTSLYKEYCSDIWGVDWLYNTQRACDDIRGQLADFHRRRRSYLRMLELCMGTDWK